MLLREALDRGEIERWVLAHRLMRTGAGRDPDDARRVEDASEAAADDQRVLLGDDVVGHDAGEKPRSIINGTMRSTSSDFPEPTGPPTPMVMGWLMV